ncbi:MAG TPA: MgtC/SapB family protein [Candidatus Paceibacterota bacterium]|nr:MgtC/SapB family protein [Candidatus Paceibacterota bacterium]
MNPLIIPGSESSMVWSLLLAALLGAVLGIERSVAGKQAGMRTYSLVSLGSCLFVLVSTGASEAFAVSFPGINPVQIAASVVVGIGFIGSGLLSLRNNGEHVELTTSSGIWVVAGIGMACGYGLYETAAAAAVISIAIFSAFLKIENGIRRRFSHPQNSNS